MTIPHADDQQIPLPYSLTDLAILDPGGPDWWGSMGLLRATASRGRNMLRIYREVLAAAPRDAWQQLRPPPTTILRLEEGLDPRPGARSVALYIHYSRSGRVSAMVLRQLTILAAEGFAILFITMAEHVPDADWQAVRGVCAVTVQRRNFGLDFGAWHDLAPEALRRWPAAEELLLVNDSVLGPIRPMAAVFAALRGGGDGLFGLTESIQGPAHLQSYFLLAHGADAVRDLGHFLTAMKISFSKNLVIRRGELLLSTWMRQRGHRTAALFGYQRVIGSVLADPEELDRLFDSQRMFRHLKAGAGIDCDAIARLTNPTHHLWRVLIRRFGFPFLKTELVQRNPLQLRGVDEWRAEVPVDLLPLLEDHLATLAVPPA